MNKFIQNFNIPSYNVDMSWRLKPASFMDLAQEAANQHANILGFGYDDLIASRTAWVLSRMHVEFTDTPKWREEMTLTTWHKGLNRLFFLRDFLMTDKEGNPRVKATTSWLILNLETRRLVRDPKLIEDGTVCTENVLETPADKVQMPKGIEPMFVMDHKVVYSDIDMNNHTNNAMYMQWAMDAIDYETASAKPLKEFTINFNRETKIGDTVSIYRVEEAREDGLHIFVEGLVEGASSFCVELIF